MTCVDPSVARSAVQLSGYTWVESIYQGEKTAVYRAIEDSSSRPVVIKYLCQDHPRFDDLVQFRNQYTVTQKLSIPGVVHSFGLEPFRNGYALIMEDVGGISLDRYLQQQAPQQPSLNLTEVLAIGLQLAEIFHHLHRERVIHKDIKPANILIHPDSKRVSLIDFSISSLLPTETQSLQNPDNLEGTLAYLAPEQTGRMNRGIDYRTDFYSLGVTLYQLLSGRLPFVSEDPLAIIHAHIAKMPVSVSEHNPHLPTMVSNIVAKLMAKNAEDRYQSALGLQHDLARCLAEWKEQGQISTFPLGAQDLSDRFLIPEKLYGRETEVKTLLAAFERAASGSAELMLVAGFSGIGKTAVVNEVHKPITRERGRFIKGKFDQFNRNLPLSAFVQALNDLVGQLLGENDAEIEVWRAKISAALGENAQVIIDLIPTLETLLGPQPPARPLSGTAAQNRFNLVFQTFIQIFTSPDHPLVIFVDDLQWADSASLNLIRVLMTEAQSQHLLLIGAYRDNEVFPGHPSMLTFNEIVKAKAPVCTLTLSPLPADSLNGLVCDTLHVSLAIAKPLTELIIQKTQGNPFFVIQFLKALHQDQLITFDYDAGHWQCDWSQVQAAALTDDVVELMTQRLRQLPEKTQQMLKLAACIGAQFDMETLATVSETSQAEVAAALWDALQVGLVSPASQLYKFFQLPEAEATANEISLTYRFLHDRVQQAAYELILETQKPQYHNLIGQRLLCKVQDPENSPILLALTAHLNLGSSLINTDEEKQTLADLNLLSGYRAQSAAAYESAFKYFTQGLQLLPENAWERHYPLVLSLSEQAAETAYLSGQLEEMQHFIDTVCEQASCLLDTIKVCEVQMQSNMAKGELVETISLGLDILAQLEIYLPKDPTPSDIEAAIGSTFAQLDGRDPLELIKLPRMSDPNILAALRILKCIAPCAYQVAPMLLPLLVTQQVKLSMTYGNAALSASSYGFLGLILCGVVGDISTGYQFGQLALSLLNCFDETEFQAETIFVVNADVLHYKNHIATTLDSLQQAYTIGLETGNLEFSALSSYIYSYHAYAAGQNLDQLAQEIAEYSATWQRLKQQNMLNLTRSLEQAISNLLGNAEQPHILSGHLYDPEKMVPMHQQANDASALYYFHFNQMILFYLLGKFDPAVEQAQLAEQYLHGVTGNLVVPLFYFYDSLCLLAASQSERDHTNSPQLARVSDNQKKLKTWSKYAPMNYQHKYQLIEAERCRLLNDKAAAIDSYDQAIAGAKKHRFIQEEAIANELAAKFYLDWGKEQIAASYMQAAYYCYAHWGATAKITDLETHYPTLLRPILQQTNENGQMPSALVTPSALATSTQTGTCKSSSTIRINESLDFATVLKASQLLSSTIELDSLLLQLTQIILQNSGGDRCALLLPQETKEWQLRALATSETSQIHAQPLADSSQLPRKLIQYVKNTRAVVSMDDLNTTLPVLDDYLKAHQPKSLLCLPLVNTGHLVGILYLENQLTSGVFTESRILMLTFLCTQAAISLENSRLYSQVQQSLTDLQQAQLQLVQSEKMSALGNLVAGVAHEINNPVGCIIGNVNATKNYVDDLLNLLDCYGEELPQPSPELLEELEELDLDYVREDLPKLIRAMKDSGERIKKISRSLRTFSRADTEDKQLFNLNEGLESTLLILRHRLKPNEQRPAIDVVGEYAEIPEIACFPGQLNQVFMNILANAIDALDEVSQQHSFAELREKPNRITVRTTLENQQVQVSIADNGPGMPESVKEKIFDHLFTTKEVGKGTGLGLAIARQIIVDTHGGRLSVNSEVGQGTEFRVQLPL